MIRNIPLITKNLLIINLIAFLAMLGLRGWGIDLNDVLGLHFFLAGNFHVYQLFTYMFMHGGWEHILFNMFALWMFGSAVEYRWGAKRFLFFYIFCGVGAGLLQEMAQLGGFYMMAYDQIPQFSVSDTMALAYNSRDYLNMLTTVGASGAIYAVMLAFGMTFPNERIFIFPIPFPIKSKWFVVICVAIELISSFASSNDGVAHLAHLGGMLFGYILIRYWRRHPDINYNRRSGQQFFDSLRSAWERRSHRSAPGNDRQRWDYGHTTGRTAQRPETDAEYNERKRWEQERTDAILDKIRRSGYDSLSNDEKQWLFDKSRK